MSLPNVDIQFVSGLQGPVNAGADNVCGLITSGVAVSGKLTLGVAFALNTLDDAAVHGITPAYDSDNGIVVYKQIKEFYEQAPAGTILWVLVTAQSVTLADMADVEATYVGTLMQASQGTITLIGLCWNPPDGYELSTNTYVSGDLTDVWMDAYSFVALSLAQENAVYLEGFHRYVRFIVEGRSAKDGSASAFDLTTLGYSHVGCVNTNSDGGPWAAVGLTLGRAAALPVQRSIAYRLDGALNRQTQTWLSSGSNAFLDPAELAGWHDKGYIQVIPVQGLVGLYFNDDLMCTDTTSDQNSLSRGRTIGKAARLTVSTYNRRVNSEVLVDSAGKIAPEFKALYENEINNQIRTQMVGPAALSAGKAYVNPDQDIIGTNQIEVQLSLQPVGVAKHIVVKIAFVKTV